MSPESTTRTGNSLVIGSPEVVGEYELPLIEQIDLKTSEYLDYGKRIGVYSALESEFVQEFIEAEGPEVVAEALSRLYTERPLAGHVDFTNFMRNTLSVGGDTGRVAATKLSSDVVCSFINSQNLFNGDNPPQGIDGNLLALKQRQYTSHRLELLVKKLAVAEPKVGRPAWFVAMAQIASELTAPELDEDDLQENGFEAARYDFNRDDFEADLGANGNQLIDTRVSCTEAVQRIEDEIGSLVLQEQERIIGDLDRARVNCIETVKKGLGDDFMVCWSTTADGLKVEKISDVDPADFRDGVTQADVDSVIMPAMLIYSQALAKHMSDRQTLRNHDKLSRSRFSRPQMTPLHDRTTQRA